jgi:hypothetical protein
MVEELDQRIASEGLRPRYVCGHNGHRGIMEGVPDVYAYQVKYDVNLIKEIIKA